ncbi:MAG: fibronectin type III domain-containing protein [Bacteroidales bacterium]|nr:fibronectin type III domain-containing protein [Bacteroidales bacterium]
MKKLMLFMLAALLGIAGANAQVTQGAIRTGEITIAGSTTSDAYGLDFDNDGVLEIRIMDFTGSPTVYNGYFAYNWEDGGTNIIADENVWDYVGVLESGVTVGSASSSLFAGYGDASFDTYGTIALGTHYLGLRIKLTDGVHYAWAEYTMTQEGDDYRATWNSCYYEATVGADIVTGNTGGSSVTPTATVIVANGTETNQYVPIYGYYVDDFLRCQTIYPASMLTDIAGKEIQGITYYLSTPAGGSWSDDVVFEVKIGTVAAEAFASASWADASSFSTVYTGVLDGRVSELTINFATPYTYTSGNLCIEVSVTTEGAYNRAYFAGITRTGASVQGSNGSSWANITPSIQNFMPKTGFIVPVSCVSPTMGTITPDTRTASVAWTEEGSATAWQLKLNDGEWIDVTTNPYTLTGLTPETDYNLQLRSNCGGGDFSYSVSSSFTTLISCPAPTTLEATPTETSLELSWVESGSASQWLMKVDDGAYQTVTNPYTLTGLTANTAYDIEVRALCGAGDTSAAVSGTYRTSCATQATPYNEGFTDHTTEAAPNCWTTVVASGTYPKVENSTYYATDGNYLTLFGNSSAHVSMVATPTLDRNANTLYLSFDAWLSSYTSDTLYVGVIDNPSDPATFTSVFSLVGTANGGAWTNYEINLSNESAIASSSSKYIAFRFYGSSDYCRLDNIVVSEPPTCAKPTGLTLDEANDNSLTISWTEAGTATKWVVKAGDGAWTQTTDNPYTITGLTANTEYAVSVRAFCDPDTSDAVSGTFSTLCGFETIPYSEDFEGISTGLPDCWEQQAQYPTSSKWDFSDEGNSGNGLVFSDWSGYNSRLILPVVDCSSLTANGQLSFYFKNPAISNGYFAHLALYYRTSSTGEWIAIDESSFAAANGDWTNVSVILPSSANAPYYQVSFLATGENTYPRVYAYLDDITIGEAPACVHPTNLTADATDNSLTLSWIENGSASKWVVKVDDGEWIQTTDNPYTISGLAANTEYAVSVRAFCDPDTSEAVSGTFSTLCGFETVPYSENFEGISSGLPECWEQVASNASRSKWDFTANGNSGNGVYFADYWEENSRLIFPVVDCSTIANNVQLNFYYKNVANNSGDIATANLYYRTSSTGAWVEISEWSLTAATAGWTEAELILPNSANAAYYQLSIWAEGADASTKVNLYLDDISITIPSDCKKPVSGSIAGITPHEAGLTWLAAAEATEYEVAYGTTNDVESRDTMFVVSDTAATLMNLDAETEYYVWVRTVCGAERTNWLALGSFTTEVACAQVTGLSLTEATLNSITIGWAIDGSEGYPSTAVMVSYKEADSTDWTTIAVSDSTFTLDSLSEGVTYNFRVTNICGTDTANFVALTASSKVCGEVADGSTTSAYIPSNTNYNYSYTQAIYTASEVGDIDTISGISYNNASTATTRTVDVYLANVENASLSGGAIDINDFTLVAENYEWNAAAGWSEIVFDTPFIHESGKDIVVAIDDNTGTYTYRSFKAHSGSGYYYYQDGSNIDPLSPSATYYGTSTTVADIRFTANCGGSVQPATCDVPTNLAVANVTDSSAYISWEGDAAQYEVEINGGASTLNDTTFFAGGLTPETDYAVRVRALCADSLTSEWTSVVNFTTPAAPQPLTCDVPTNLAVADVTTTSATISWDGITVPETFDGDWNLYMAEGDSVHTTVTPNAMMHTLLQYMGADFNDIDTTISVANSLIPVSIEPAGGDQMNISGSFQMEMIGVDEPVTFHFATTGTVGSTGMTIAPATINETVRAMNAINIDFTGSVTFVQPTALPVGGNLTIEIATISISGYGDTTVNMGVTLTGSVSISMTGSQLHASGTRDAVAQYPYYELVVTNTATGVETPVVNATTPYALENLTPSTAYTVKIRTHCDENTTSDWSDTVGFRTLDEPVVVDSCDAPTNLAVANVTAHSAAISWNGSAAQYEVELNGTVAATVNTNNYNAQGLDASTVYVVKVRALCDNSLTSEWSDTIGFRTLDEPVVNDSCDMPTNLAVSNVTANSATITWNGSAAQYEVELNGTVAATVSTNSYNAQGLTASTIYIVRVRALCDNSAASEWSDTIGFRTLEGEGIDAIDANYSVNIYPNPASDRVTVNVEGMSGKAQVSVIDLSGRTLMSDTMTDGTVQLNVSSLAQGSYFVRISGERFTTVRKLIVK